MPPTIYSTRDMGEARRERARLLALGAPAVLSSGLSPDGRLIYFVTAPTAGTASA